MFDELGQDMRSRILRGAFEALTEHGAPNTSVENVLKTAGVSRRTFYQYFHGMAGVMATLYEMAMDQLVAEIRTRVDEEPNPARKVIQAIDTYVEYQRRGGPALIAMQAEAIRSDKELAVYRAKTFDSLVEIVDTATRESLGVGCDPLVYRSVLMGIEGMVIHVQRDGTFTPEDSARVRYVGIAIFFQVLAGIANMPQAPE